MVACAKVRTCPADNTWQRYIGGALGSATDLEEHLDGCAECRALFANLARGTEPTMAEGTDPTLRAEPVPTSIVFARSLELQRGTIVDRYVVLGTLGRGGMGVVYKAFDPQLDRAVALKLVTVDPLGDGSADATARLLREAKTLAQLSHPNVVAVHDAGTHGDDVFVAMEFVAGKTLRHWLEADARAPREILDVFLAAAAGLAAAHREGIAHRDFKPENVIVGDDGRVRVLDFGLARLASAPKRPSLPPLSAVSIGSMHDSEELTREGAIMGTPAYMAPEQDRGEEADHRSDQFSFCASLYEALFGQRPFAGRTYIEMAAQRAAGDMRATPVVRGVTPRVRSAVLQGLRVDPRERFASMEAVIAALDERPSQRRFAIAAAVMGVAAAIAGGWAIWVSTTAPATLDEQCAASGREVERVWNDKRRADVRAGFASLGASGERFATAIDEYATGWSSRRVAACKLARAGDAGHDRDQLASRRLSCLDASLTKLDASVSVFTHAPNAALLGRVDTILGELPPLAQCDATDTTAVVTEAKRDEWKPLIEQLVRGQLALSGNDLDEAARVATSIIEAARATNDREPLAAALLLLGQARAKQGSPEARELLDEAIRVATAVREEGIVVEAWLAIIERAFTDRRHLDGIEHALFGAEVAAERLSADSPLHDRLAYASGTVRVMRGDMDGALPRLEATIAAYRRDEAKNTHQIAAVETSLGVAQLFRGEYDAAEQHFARSVAVWADLPFPHTNLAITRGWLGEVATWRADYGAAETHFSSAIEVAEQLGRGAHSQLGKLSYQLGYVYARTGRCAAAAPLFARAKELAGDRPASVAQALYGQALCTKKKAASIALLERAAKLTADAPTTLLQLAQIEIALARALGHGPRARALVTRARTAFARYPGARREIAAADALLVTFGKK